MVMNINSRLFRSIGAFLLICIPLSSLSCQSSGLTNIDSTPLPIETLAASFPSQT